MDAPACVIFIPILIGRTVPGNLTFSLDVDRPRSSLGQVQPLSQARVARLSTAWESTAGRIKPKAKRRAKSSSGEPEIVDADPSRPPRSYRATDAFMAGDTIDHPTLGRGVVQGLAGPTKINVLFEGVKRVLVHGRERSVAGWHCI